MVLRNLEATNTRSFEDGYGTRLREYDYLADGGYSHAEIVQHINNLQRAFMRQNVARHYIQVQLLNNVGAVTKSFWEANNGGFRKINNLFRGNQYLYGGGEMQDHYAGFSVTIKKNNNAGGASKHNDCLFDVLTRNIHNFPKMLYDPARFKKYLKLSRDDLVPVTSFPKIEERFTQYSFNVSGDCEYTSKYTDRKLTLNIVLRNGHYRVKHNTKQKKRWFTNRTVVVDCASTNQRYDGKTITDRSIPMKKGVHQVSMTGKNAKKYTIQEFHKRYVDSANELQNLSYKKINLLTFTSVGQQSLYLFEQLHNATHPEEFSETQEKWIRESVKGGLTFAKKGYKGYGEEIDYKSAYPSIMKSNMCFPVKEGKFETIDEVSITPLYGIYRCTVEPSHILIKSDPDRKYYTHLDLRCALKLNLKITLAQDGEPNFLHFNRDSMVTGKQLFGNYVDYLFKFKNKGNFVSKIILNSLWGKLMESVKGMIRYHDINSSKLPDVSRKWSIESMTRTGNPNTRKIVYFDNTLTKSYKSKYARLCTFLLAKARFNMMNAILPVVEDVVQIHTDGFILSTHRDDIVLTDKIGGLAMKQKGEVHVKDCNSVTFK